MKPYTSDQVVVAVAGILVMTGRGEKEFIKIAPMNPLFSTKVGSDGEVARSRSNDHRAKVELTLLQTSSANAFLSALLEADTLASNGAGVGPFLCQDLDGLSLYTGDACWITEHPEVVFANEVEQRLWKIEVANLIAVTGGN